MPQPLGQSLKLVPPDLGRLKFGPEVVDALRMLASYLRVQALNLANEQRQVHDALNWLITQQHIVNLVPDSGASIVTNWTVGAPWALVAPLLPSGGGGFQFTAAAGAQSGQVTGVVTIPVLTNTTYSFSGWIDASNVVSGTVSWQVIDAGTSAVLGSVTQTDGKQGRVETYVDMGASTSVLVRLVATTVVGSGLVTAMQPQLELPLVTSGAGAEGATLYRSSGPGVGGAPTPPAASVAHFNYDLTGTKDGVNTDFTVPFTIASDADGNPAAVLSFRLSRTLYTATNPPPRGYWTLVGPSTIRVNTDDAPQAGDSLVFDWVLSA